MKKEKLPEIFKYLDYREYLQHAFAALKQHDPKFSFRAFAMAGGISSPNFLKLVLSAKRNLTRASTAKTIAALRLNKQESDFFESFEF